jgi:hypothetical protein
MISTCRAVVSGLCLSAVLGAAALIAAATERADKPVVPLDPARQFEHSKPAKEPSMSLQFDHIGLITTEKKPNETYVAATKVWVTDIPSHPYRVEWLRFEPDSPVKGPVREKPHVAFRVDSIAEAAKGLKVLIEPFDAGIARVGFYETGDGAVVEFMEYYEKPKE